MRCLLDTHTFLWWVTDDRQLSTRVRTIIEDAENDVYFSAASAWEIAIKANSRGLSFKGDPRSFVTTQLAANGFQQLAIDVRHVLEVTALPPLHRDPFDRILVAQAIVEELVLLSRDALIRQYDAPVIW
jgi:PIN domain nuclease of toxin-antitoxin system